MHDHQHTNKPNEQRLFWAMLITGSFMIIEVIGGVLSGSLALLTDAGHMLSDFVALLLAWYAFRISRRPADTKRSYGYDRFQVLAAFVNGLTLLLIAAWIFIEAIHRFLEPAPVLAGPMLVVAVIGLGVNIAAFLILSSGHTDNLNLSGAAQHVLGDMLGSIAAIIAAIVILTTGFMQADPLLSLLVAPLLVRSGLRIVRRSSHILLEGTPEEIAADDLISAVRELDEVLDVHDVHLWCLTAEKRLATLHVVLEIDTDIDLTRQKVEHLLKESFDIWHLTVQMETKACE